MTFGRQRTVWYNKCALSRSTPSSDVTQLNAIVRSMHNASRTKSKSRAHVHMLVYTGCNRRNGPDFGRVFLRSNYTDITQNTYIQS